MSPPRRGAGDAVKDGFLFLQEVQKNDVKRWHVA
jgi:hypothetical protein